PSRVFKGKVAFIHPHLDAATRTLRVRLDVDNPRHDLRPGMYASVTLRVPVTQLGLVADALREEWRDRTAVDLLAHTLFPPPGATAGAGLGPLTRAAVGHALARAELVLAVPESAVIDTGSRRFVYREAWPGVYDGVEVQLGPRSGGFYPVLRGLEAGRPLATAGSVPIDP